MNIFSESEVNKIKDLNFKVVIFDHRKHDTPIDAILANDISIVDTPKEAKTANDFYMPPSEPFSKIGALPYLYETIFVQSFFTDNFSSFLYALSVVIFYAGLALYMFRKNIFIKV